MDFVDEQNGHIYFTGRYLRASPNGSLARFRDTNLFIQTVTHLSQLCTDSHTPVSALFCGRCNSWLDKQLYRCGLAECSKPEQVTKGVGMHLVVCARPLGYTL